MAAQDGHHEHHGRDDHGHAAHKHGADASERRLRAALALLFAFTVVEAVGGFWANSIALLAEAAHMLADSASLLLAIIAIRVSKRPPARIGPTAIVGTKRWRRIQMVSLCWR